LQGLLAEQVDAGIGELRVGVWTEPFNGASVDAASAAAAIAAADLLAEMGCGVEVSAPAVLSSDELWEAAKTAMAIACAADAAAWKGRIGRPLGEADLEPRTWGMVQAGQAVTAPEAMMLIEHMQDLAATAFEWFEQYDLLVTPTTAGPAMRLGDYLTDYVSGLGSAFTRPINLTGQPAISLPLGWPDDGLPRGVQLVAAYGRDDLLIRAAGALEQAAPWADRRPPGI
jgi:amidase